MTHDVGIASLLEREGHDLSHAAAAKDASTADVVLEVPSVGASAMEVQAGDFEIKCATKCDFVKKGSAEFLDSPFGEGSGAGKGATKAAQVLEEMYLKLANLQDQLAADPTNGALVKARQALQAKINAQTALLNALAGGGALEAPVSASDEAHLESLRNKLAEIMAKLSESPDDKPLQSMREQLQQEIEDRQRAIAAQKTLAEKRKAMEEKIVQYESKLDKLKSEAGAMPNDATLAKEIARVEATLAELRNSQRVITPQEDCSRVCAKSAGEQSNQNCVRTCVKVIRMMSYKIAKAFL